MAFLENTRHCLAAGFVQQDMADHKVEIAIWEAGFLCVHLGKIDFIPLGCCAGVSIADYRTTNINAPDFGIREIFLERQGRMTDGAAHVQNPHWLEVRLVAAQIVADRAAHIVIVRPHISHCIEINAPII